MNPSIASRENLETNLFFKILLVSLLAAFSQMAIAESAVLAKQPVEKLNAALIDVMKNAGRLGYQGRYKKLEPVVKEVFQFEAIAQIALGAHWKKLDQSQKQTFIAKLTELSIATYAAQFNAYDGEAFHYDSTEDTKPDRAIVRYTMFGSNGRPIKFEYIVSRPADKWQIVNIVVDGISDLALKKAQYTSVIDREGFDSLLAKLTEKVSDYVRKSK